MLAQVHARKLTLDPDVTDDVLRQVARDLPGLSGRSRRPPYESAAGCHHAELLGLHASARRMHLPPYTSSLVRLQLSGQRGGVSPMGIYGDVIYCFLGVAGAELANVLNEAALETVRRRGESVSTVDIYNGMDRILQVPVALRLLTPAAIRADHADSG